MPIVKAELAAHRLFLRERINTSGQQASPFLQIDTPSLVLPPRRPLPHPRFVCPFVARAAYLSMTRKTTDELKAPSLLYYVILLIWPVRSVSSHFYWFPLSDAAAANAYDVSNRVIHRCRSRISESRALRDCAGSQEFLHSFLASASHVMCECR